MGGREINFRYLTKKNVETYSILPLADLENAEFLSASAKHDQAANFVVDGVGFLGWFLVPFGAEGGQEFFPIDEAFVVEHVGDRLDFVTLRWCFCGVSLRFSIFELNSNRKLT